MSRLSLCSTVGHGTACGANCATCGGRDDTARRSINVSYWLHGRSSPNERGALCMCILIDICASQYALIGAMKRLRIASMNASAIAIAKKMKRKMRDERKEHTQATADLYSNPKDDFYRGGHQMGHTTKSFQGAIAPQDGSRYGEAEYALA